MGSLNTLIFLATVTDPIVVLAIWALACLAALGVGLLIAWVVQPQYGDPFAHRQLQDRIGDLFARHAAIDKQARHRPEHTAAAVAESQAAAAVAEPGRHRTGDRSRIERFLDTQDINRTDMLAAVDELRERAA
jgi:hypothetical protein